MASAQEVIGGLVARGVPQHIAVGIAGNMQIESDGFKTDVNEYAPLVEGSRGGYGLNQWTGPRRRQFEQYVAERGANPADLDTQLDFTLWELQNTEKAAGQALASAQSPAEAARIYSEKFLRPGIPHLDRRIAAAEALAGGEYPQAGQQRPQSGLQRPSQGPGYAPQPYTPGNYLNAPQQPQNQLAAGPEQEQRGPQVQNMLQDPRVHAPRQSPCSTAGRL